MSLLPISGYIPLGTTSRIVPTKAEEIRKEAEDAALETLRSKHPELFLMRGWVPTDPNVHCMKTRYGIDVTKDSLLEVLLRPHMRTLCNGGDNISSTYYVVTNVLDMLDIDEPFARTQGIPPPNTVFQSSDNNAGTYISYLRQIISNLHKLKTRTQLAEERRVAMELLQKQAAAAREEERRDKEYVRIKRNPRLMLSGKVLVPRKERNAALAEHGIIPTAGTNADLLDLYSPTTATEPELLDMNALRKAEVKKNLDGLFGGKRRTRRYNHRRNRTIRKSRKYSKNRRT